MFGLYCNKLKIRGYGNQVKKLRTKCNSISLFRIFIFTATQLRATPYCGCASAATKATRCSG
jgi:hypothetical protein